MDVELQDINAVAARRQQAVTPQLQPRLHGNGSATMLVWQNVSDQGTSEQRTRKSTNKICSM